VVQASVGATRRRAAPGSSRNRSPSPAITRALPQRPLGTPAARVTARGTKNLTTDSSISVGTAAAKTKR
jgi:hypothetical protein